MDSGNEVLVRIMRIIGLEERHDHGLQSWQFNDDLLSSCGIALIQRRTFLRSSPNSFAISFLSN